MKILELHVTSQWTDKLYGMVVQNRTGLWNLSTQTVMSCDVIRFWVDADAVGDNWDGGDVLYTAPIKGFQRSLWKGRTLTGVHFNSANGEWQEGFTEESMPKFCRNGFAVTEVIDEAAA